ncbi:RNA polymerase sigma factor RpoD [Enhygromyxa salina]|uniref:RNA polymerase sigma factor n=1 Tax=Enhygromyxa salina TaxID=215803 RepID=A0A2S9YG72_9BACT|nr:sigma-70 family RNA polymerase sigma factor [Enhygromyxa salina]PRQ04041.1 RNA polymerase sigma factor RpoD [Enhygromyxa salina]
MSDLEVMSAKEELEAATRIFELRKAYWEAILSYPPFVDGIVDYIEGKIDDEEVPTKEVRAMRKASRNLRDRETRAHKDAFDAAIVALTERMLDLDTDNIAADQIADDINAIESGTRHGLEVLVKPPREGSRPFAAYAADIRAASRRLRSAKNAFVKANLRLVVSIARRFNHGRMPLQDLIQEGNIGLMKAVDRFDYRKGFRFSTYGSWWIRHAISRAIADKGRQVRLPVHMIDAYHKVNKARRELEAKHGREPTREELAKHTGLALAKIEKMGTMLVDNPISIDKPVSDDDGRRVGDFLEDENAETPGEGLEADALNDQVKRLVSKLRPIEADIIRKRFGLIDEEELTLKEIGGQYSLSRERIRQLQEQALGKIRRELKRLELM